MAGFNGYRHSLWIGIGEKSHFYTLRETHPVYVPGPGGNGVVNGVYQGTIELGHHHVQNLSQDPAEAIAKARAIAAERGLPLDPVTVEDLSGQLEAIKRATAEQLEARVRAEAARQAQWEAERAERDALLLELVAQGICPIGRYANQPIADIDRGYATWLLDKREELTGLMRALADKVAAEHAHLRLPVPDPVAKYGALKLRSDIEATVIRVGGFQTQFGYTGLITLVTDDGRCLLAKGGWRVKYWRTPCADGWDVEAMPGERVKIKATVVDYREYNGQMQTVINRVKEDA